MFSVIMALLSAAASVGSFVYYSRKRIPKFKVLGFIAAALAAVLVVLEVFNISIL